MDNLEPDPKDLMKTINNLSIILFKLMGVDIYDVLKELDSGAINYFAPQINTKNQFVMSLKMYLKLNKSMRNRYQI